MKAEPSERLMNAMSKTAVSLDFPAMAEHFKKHYAGKALEYTPEKQPLAISLISQMVRMELELQEVKAQLAELKIRDLTPEEMMTTMELMSGTVEYLEKLTETGEIDEDGNFINGNV